MLSLLLSFLFVFNADYTSDSSTFDSIQPHLSQKSTKVIQSIKIADREGSKYDLNLLSQNTWGLPVSLKGHDQALRFSKISNALLKENFDVISLQEVFSPSLRTSLIDGLSKTYYLYSDYSCNQMIIPFFYRDCYGGLMTVSRHPILEEKFFRFPKYTGISLIEKIGSKGVLITIINKNGQELMIINTHLYAGNGIKAEKYRLLQIQFIHEILKNSYTNYPHPVFLVGDINVPHPDNGYSIVYEYITTKMEFADSKKHITDEDYTIDHSKNTYVRESEPQAKLDYVFIRSHYSDAISITNQGRFKSDNLLISDHFGWKISCKFLGIKNTEIAQTIK